MNVIASIPLKADRQAGYGYGESRRYLQGEISSLYFGGGVCQMEDERPTPLPTGLLIAAP
jgi:hypothetical protein